jgi:hypothetical protein
LNFEKTSHTSQATPIRSALLLLLHTGNDASSFHRGGRAVQKLPQEFAQVRHVIVDDLCEKQY